MHYRSTAARGNCKAVTRSFSVVVCRFWFEPLVDSLFELRVLLIDVRPQRGRVDVLHDQIDQHRRQLRAGVRAVQSYRELLGLIFARHRCFDHRISEFLSNKRENAVDAGISYQKICVCFTVSPAPHVLDKIIQQVLAKHRTRSPSRQLCVRRRHTHPSVRRSALRAAIRVCPGVQQQFQLSFSNARFQHRRGSPHSESPRVTRDRPANVNQITRFQQLWVKARFCVSVDGDASLQRGDVIVLDQEAGHPNIGLIGNAKPDNALNSV